MTIQPIGYQQKTHTTKNPNFKAKLLVDTKLREEIVKRRMVINGADLTTITARVDESLEVLGTFVEKTTAFDPSGVIIASFKFTRPNNPRTVYTYQQGGHIGETSVTFNPKGLRPDVSYDPTTPIESPTFKKRMLDMILAPIKVKKDLPPEISQKYRDLHSSLNAWLAERLNSYSN